MHANRVANTAVLSFMYKQYMDELRAKRAANVEARNVYTKLCELVDMHAKCVANEVVLSSECTHSIWMNCAQSSSQKLNLGMYITLCNYDMHAKRIAN